MADIPEFKKFCFYIPMRCGVIVWGLLNVITTLVIFSLCTTNFSYMITYAYNQASAITIFIILTVGVCAVNILYSLMLMLAGHRENLKWLNCYYSYGKLKIAIYTAMLILLNITFWCGSYDVADSISESFGYVWGYIIVYNPLLGILDILTQGYFLLVLRSYITQLGDGIGNMADNMVGANYENLPGDNKPAAGVAWNYS